MGRYVVLTAAKGYLPQVATLQVDDAATAEAEADAFVDRHFAPWDRSAWSPATTPDAVRQVALKVAAAHYLRLDFVRANSVDTDKLPYFDRLVSEAEETAKAMRETGVLFGARGAEFPAERAAGGICVELRW